jgi:transcriptional regulator with XRE-family HTH domain
VSQLSPAVAAEIDRLRQELGWSRRELARQAGLAQPTVVRALGGVHPFDLDDLPPICRALGLDVSVLIAAAEAR